VIAIQSLADLLRMRLRDNLREELGATYGVDVRGSASREPAERFQFTIGFASDPHRVDELVEAVFAEIAQLRADGPQEDDIGKVRETQFRSREVDFRQNHFWINQLMSYTLNEWGLEEIPASPSRHSAVTADMLQRAALLYLDPENYVKVTLLPEANSGVD
jgi:zinc protease